MRLALAELALEYDQRNAAYTRAGVEAGTPPRWRAVHSQLDRAAAAVAAREAHI